MLVDEEYGNIAKKEQTIRKDLLPLHPVPSKPLEDTKEDDEQNHANIAMEHVRGELWICINSSEDDEVHTYHIGQEQSNDCADETNRNLPTNKFLPIKCDD